MAPPVTRAAIAAAATRFGLVGAACALLNVAIVYVGTEWLHQRYWIAALATCVITIPLSYFLHRGVTFRLAGPAHGAEFARFLVAQLSQFAIGLALLAAVVEGLHLRPWIAMAGVTAVMVVYGFVASSTWVFRWFRRPVRRGAARGLRVLQVSAFYPAHGGGIEVVAGRLAAGLAESGVAVTWMAGGVPAEWPADATPPGLTIAPARSIDFLERRLGLPAPVWGAAALRRLWREVGACDLVHVHDYLYLPTLTALLFARLRRRPVVLTQHIGDIAFDSPGARRVLRGLNRSLGRFVLGRADQVVFVGRPVRDYFAAFVHFRRPPQLIANGVDHDLYRPLPERANAMSAVGGPALRALFVGRFVEKKGLALLRECASLTGLHWTFVGRGPLSPADWPEAPTQRELAGMLAPAQVAAAMQLADLLVLPSKGEGFPLVVQEALACGTPVLVSQEVAEAFPQTDAACVFAVDASGPEAAARLRAALAGLAADLPRVRGARAAAAALAAQWSWAACLQSYRQLYDALLPPADALTMPAGARPEPPR